MSAGNKLLQAAAGVGGAGEDTDPDFANAVLLLNGDDAPNGGQNNTFLDSSSNAHTITRNGNVTQGSFSPFSVDDGKWGNYFGGSGYLSTGSNAINAFGTGDFTIDLFVNFDGVFKSGASVILFDTRNTLTTDGIVISLNKTSGVAQVYLGPINTAIAGSTVIESGVWYNITVSRSSGVTTLYVNGSTEASSADTGNYTHTSSFIGSGRNGDASHGYQGYISNFRLIKGSSVTPPSGGYTSPLNAVTDTQLLTCQSNRFIDNSSNNLALTLVNTGPKVVPFSPFPQTTAYDASTNGGSGYFDGSGDYLTVADANDFNMSTGDFTAEGWIYRTGTGTTTFGDAVIFTTASPSDFQGFGVLDRTGVFAIVLDDGGGSPWTLNANTGVAIENYQWIHVAFVRNGNTFYLYKNGTQVWSGGGAYTLTNTNNLYSVGGRSNVNQFFLGHISNHRLVKGTAVYTSAFTPPTAPVTSDANTSLLCNFTNASIKDVTGRNVLETVGNAQVDTTTVKYGTGAMEFDGTGDYLNIPDSDQFAFGSGDFTIEAWIYPNSLGTYNAIIGQWPDNGGSANNSFVLETIATEIDFYWVSGTTIYNLQNIGTIPTGQWTHVAVARSGNNIYGFINGTLEKTGSITQTLNNPTSNVTVGGQIAGAGMWNGYIDDLRITKGIARYTANFTPPEAALPVIGEE